MSNKQIPSTPNQPIESIGLPLDAEFIAALVRRAHGERNRYMAGLFMDMVGNLAGFAQGMRGIAAACTAARLRHS